LWLSIHLLKPSVSDLAPFFLERESIGLPGNTRVPNWTSTSKIKGGKEYKSLKNKERNVKSIRCLSREKSTLVK